MKTPLHILGHLDLGDAIIMNGLVRSISDDEPEIVWYVKPKYVADVAAMVADMRGVSVKPAGGGYEDPKAEWLTAERTLKLGFFNSGKFHTPRWDSEFYRQAGVPFSARWNRWYLPTELFVKTVPPSAPFCLVHDDEARGFKIDTFRLPAAAEMCPMFVVERGSFWGWLKEIYQASEIHVIDSSVLNLVESLKGVSAKLFFHRYARPMVVDGANYPTLFSDWKILD